MIVAQIGEDLMAGPQTFEIPTRGRQAVAVQPRAGPRSSKHPMFARLCVLIAVLACVFCGSAAAPPAGPRGPEMQTGFFVNGDVRLSYRLDLPARTGRVGAVVFGHGSGRQHKGSCRFLADGFLSRGFATLCYDKRGVGESSGTFVFVGHRDSIPVFEDLASDLAAGVELLKSHPDIDPARIGLAGVSQAGWIVPIAATKSRPAFMILLVGPTVSVGVENFYSRIVEHGGGSVEEGYRQLPSFTGFHGFDPTPVLEKLDVPGLWLLGGEDRSIPTPTTVAILDGLIASGRPFTHVVFPGVGHDLSGAPIWREIDRWLAQTQGLGPGR
jgi:pimeloyl-ACP methyl ester carboxylesterase